ncbi:SDR family oxidoreductase [Streptomyces sp. NPDC002574]|uniref:SDR family oxidoreductase n=1 Tax=Streptomyces sp. NPDC002574 TaxID=3364652 RepID=UPI00367DEBAD
MRVVVAGATGLVGSKTISMLRERGADVVPLTRREGPDAVTDRDLERALRCADVVVDVTYTASPAEQTSLRHFRSTTTGLLAAAEKAGVAHHVILSAVGTEQLLSGWFRAKLLLEEQVRRSPIPHSIVRAAPSFECVEATVLADAPGDSGVHVAPALMRPVSSDDVATTVAHVAMGEPLFGTLAIAGPEEYRLDELAVKLLAARCDTRDVVTDAHAWFFGAALQQRSLLAGAQARTSRTTFDEWLAQR